LYGLAAMGITATARAAIYRRDSIFLDRSTCAARPWLCNPELDSKSPYNVAETREEKRRRHRRTYNFHGAQTWHTPTLPCDSSLILSIDYVTRSSVVVPTTPAIT
jgi:hypothetical protein